MKYLSLFAAVVIVCGITACGGNSAPVAAENESAKVAEVSEAGTAAVSSNATSQDNQGEVLKINTQQFINLIFDYKSNPSKWVYKGGKPAIIDFYADWCRPCKMVAPLLDELAKEYKGQINIYKINTDEENELSGSVFGIQSIPSILYIPSEGQPQMFTGAQTKEEYKKMIETILLNKK